MSRNPLYRLGTFKAALGLAKILPRDMAQEIAGAIGSASFQSSPGARTALRANLARITPLRGNALDELCRQNFANFVRMLADYFYCSTAEPAQIGALIEERRGLAHVEAARARGKGGILITAHLGAWELGGILLGLLGIPLTVVTLEEPSSELTKWREDYRRRLGIKTVAIGSDPFSFVEIISALRRNEFVAMLVERPAAGTGTPVRFFDGETEFSSGPALLWQHTKAAVLPAFVLQTNNRRYVSFAEPAIEMDTDAVASTQRIAHAFEAIIRLHPEQWYNYTPLWKDAGPDLPDSSS